VISSEVVTMVIAVRLGKIVVVDADGDVLFGAMLAANESV
jgi:hypothetical protein